MVKIDGMTPLIQVFDMPTSLRFYRDALGFEVVSDSGNGNESSWVWLRLNGCDLMLNDQYEPGHVPDAPLPERTKWHGDTCMYFGCPDVDGVHAYLNARKIDCSPPSVAQYGMKQLYVRDPDGYNLCFQQPVKSGDG